MATDGAVRKPAGQLFRYGLVGVVSNLLGYLLFLTITHFGVEPKIAVTFLYPIGAAIGFVGNRQWAFTHRGRWLGSVARYAIAHVGGYLLNLCLLLVLVDLLGYAHQVVQAFAIVAVSAFLFVAFRLFVFPPARLGDKVIE